MDEIRYKVKEQICPLCGSVIAYLEVRGPDFSSFTDFLVKNSEMEYRCIKCKAIIPWRKIKKEQFKRVFDGENFSWVPF